MHIKTSAEVAHMAEAGRRLAEVLSALAKSVSAGMRTEALDWQARAFIKEVGATPAFLGYPAPGSDRKFPAALCVSVNDQVVHGIPSGYIVREGDVVKLDLGLVFGGWYVDSARTVIVGKGIPVAEKLVRVTEEALQAGVRAARPGGTLGDIGAAIEEEVRRAGFSVVQKLCGHGIGRELHEEPSVLNTGKPGRGEELQPGMVLAIEPMVAAGSGAVRQLPDDTFITADGSLAAHFEDTEAITEAGPRILTRM